MSLYDNLGVFSDAQPITEPAASTNYIDLAQTKSQIGVGTPIYLCIRTAVAPTEPADTISIELQTDADDGAGDPAGTWRTVMMVCDAAGAEITADDARFATAGAWILRCSLPYECDERYVRLYYNNTVTDGTFTIDAWLEHGPVSDRNTQVTTSPVGNP